MFVVRVTEACGVRAFILVGGGRDCVCDVLCAGAGVGVSDVTGMGCVRGALFCFSVLAIFVCGVALFLLLFFVFFFSGTASVHGWFGFVCVYRVLFYAACCFCVRFADCFGCCGLF